MMLRKKVVKEAHTPHLDKLNSPNGAPKPKYPWRFLREAMIVTGVILGVVVVAQLLYPTERTLPFTKVADKEVGSLTKRETVSYLFDVYSSAELTVTYGDKSLKTTLDKAGILVDFQKAADAAARYPWWQRLVPFSLFYKSLVINASPEIAIDEQLSKQFAKKVQEVCNQAARDAVVEVKEGTVVLQQGKAGRECTDKSIQKGLSSVLMRHGKAQVNIDSRNVEPIKTDAIAKVQFDQAQAMITSGLTIVIGNQRTLVPKEVIASWIRFTDDAEKKKYVVSIDDAAVRSYLESQKQGVYIAPIATTVRIVDGDETSRELGQSGRDIDYDASMTAIKKVLEERRTKTVTAPAKTIPAPINYVRSYTQSQRGLQRLLSDIVAQKGNYGVSVFELGGLQRAASVNGDKKYVTASTYKLFVAYMVLKDLESGALKWEDVIVDGLNVRQCFEEMIVRSANRCSVAYINRYGGANIVAKMHELGFSTVERNTTWWATSNDLAAYMKKLEQGELLQGSSREYLLGLLKRQVWRLGIPTGIKGVTIADKVGFLEDYIHDVAIVYGPKGTYILAIMTKGGSYAGIADVARRVHAYMNE